MVSPSSQRVMQHTSQQSDEQIRQQMRINAEYYAAHPQEIDRRLRELDQEWDMERLLELNSAALSLAGLLLGLTGSRKWLLIPLAVQGFFLQHGVQGWCPPLPMFRLLGVRTQREIESERYALKALRGDFTGAAEGDAGTVLEAVRH